MIDFNRPYLTGDELNYITDAVNRAHISGDGYYSKKCHEFFESRFGFRKVFLTTSCTDALEMSALLAGIGPGDEVIIPSFTFVSTGNAFALRGAKLVFADCAPGHPNMDASRIEELITPKTKAIVPVHYAGVACDMDAIMNIANKYSITVIEDAAQSIDSYFIAYNGTRKPLGSIGHMGALSFHETKNISCGEGGMLIINDTSKFQQRAEIVREKGTNRSAFFRGETDKYSWVDIGSSFLPSDILAAFLWAQFMHLDAIQEKRKTIWEHYFEQLKILQDKGCLHLPQIPPFATNNAHMFYVVCANLKERTQLFEHLRKNEIFVVTHYLPLHQSPYISRLQGTVQECPFACHFADSLLRLPLFFQLSVQDVEFICAKIRQFYGINKNVTSR